MSFFGGVCPRFVAMLAVVLVSHESMAVLVVSVGAVELQPNQAGQQVMFFVSGGDLVGGMGLRLQVGDGGPIAGGVQTSATVPTITNIDLTTGTIFSGGDQFNPIATDLVFGDDVFLLTDVVGNGKIATVTFSTVGLAPGPPVPLLLTTTTDPVEITVFPGVTTTLNNGTVQVVPEPSSLLYVGLSCLAGCLVKLSWTFVRDPC